MQGDARGKKPRKEKIYRLVESKNGERKEERQIRRKTASTSRYLSERQNGMKIYLVKPLFRTE